MHEPETFTFTKTIKLEDADGRPIRVGSVLREINDGEQGVVIRIVRAGDTAATPFDAVGDIGISTSRGSTRCTNRYNQWKHVPRNEQTYRERYESWRLTPFDENDLHERVSKDESIAIDGIMALLPDDIVDWDYGPFPDTLEDALQFLTQHLQEKDEKK